MDNHTDKFVRYLLEKMENIPEQVLQKAELCIDDYDAVIKAGLKGNKLKWKNYLDNAGTFGGGIIVNGFNAHVLELDDGHRFSMLHPGAVIITALKEVCRDREELKRGIVMGYEAACRIGISMQPSHKEKGFHGTGTCGTIGSALGIALAKGMDEDQIKRVLSCAATSASGLLEIQEQDSELKGYNIGQAAINGILASYMGYTEFASPDDILMGDRGFIRLLSDDFSPEKMYEEKEYFEIERIYVKPYASCRHSHAAIEAALSLRKCLFDKFTVNDIKKIVVRTYKAGIKGHDHFCVGTVSSAKLSTPYSVALAIIKGSVGYRDFETDGGLDNETIELARRITLETDAEFTKEYPKKRISAVDIILKNGEILTKQVDYALGEPENPMDKNSIKKKIEELQ